MTLNFPVGSVAYNLMHMRGVWHDHLEAFDPSGAPLAEDTFGGQPGPLPYDNLVYIDFDGVNYLQTNVTFRGRPLHVRSFAGVVRDGVLVFNPLGPNAPEIISAAAGPNVLIYTPRRIEDAWQRYADPDVIHLLGHSERIRTTFLYKNGLLVRTLTAKGYRLAPSAERRVLWDPRGADGPVHEVQSMTGVYQR